MTSSNGNIHRVTGPLDTKFSILWCLDFQINTKLASEISQKLLLTSSNGNNCWWRHQMETFSALLALSKGNSPVTSEFPSERSVTRNFDVFFNLRLNKRLNKPSRRRWFETPPRSLWRHRNVDWAILQTTFSSTFCWMKMLETFIGTKGGSVYWHQGFLYNMYRNLW